MQFVHLLHLQLTLFQLFGNEEMFYMNLCDSKYMTFSMVKQI